MCCNYSFGKTRKLQTRRKPSPSSFEKYIGWNALKEDIAQMYMKTFSEKELEDINCLLHNTGGPESN